MRFYDGADRAFDLRHVTDVALQVRDARHFGWGALKSMLYTTPPAFAKCAQQAAPMPVVPPVTITTSPLSDGEPKPASKRVFAAAADSHVAAFCAVA